MANFISDYAGSDDLAEIMELSRQEAGPSGLNGTGSARITSELNSGPEQTFKAKQTINGRLIALDLEIRGVDDDIGKLQTLRAQLLAERQNLLQQLSNLSTQPSNAKGKGREANVAPSSINYLQEQFDWSGELKARMKKVFNISSFRLCQEGVCNANMDGRDIVCIMPTGGGKSLTYQLPALLNPGCTLVISPLISLITDQILHLREAGVDAVMLTGSTSKEESRDIFTKLTQSVGGRTGRGNFGPVDGAPQRDIKLCYVTPEKIAKSKTFTSMLEKLASGGKLARIVIDEAHCVSQLGHDFRPDYKKLSILRQLFPRVPILALSATCPPKVLKDLILTLRLKPVTDGQAANTNGTVYFSAPLYRKNLHYQIVQKPASATAVIKSMTEYILTNHKEDSGIVYCLSKKDAEVVAAGLMDTSGGKIRTGVYHADVGDAQKEQLHKRWRRGEVKVVCATIAFGLGIDKGDVRFVLHHSISKSLDGYYQETGRAGRDGKDADCVLYYRPQDASRLSALVCGELEGQEKLHDILRFTQELEECRKIQFVKYFSASSSLSTSAWTTDEKAADERCGHCDNCTRAPETIQQVDVTVQAWQALKVVEQIEMEGGRVTIAMLSDLCRGAGGKGFDVPNGKRGKGKERFELNLTEIAGGPVTLSKEDAEKLLVHLILSHHLKESFHSTAYSINVYVNPGPNSIRLSRWSRQDLENGKGPRIFLTFLRKQTKKGASTRKASTIGSGKPSESRVQKRKRTARDVQSDPDEVDSHIEDEGDLENFSKQIEEIEEIPDSPDDEESEDGEWTFTMRNDAKKDRYKELNGKSSGRKKTRASFNNVDNGIISLEISD